MKNRRESPPNAVKGEMYAGMPTVKAILSELNQDEVYEQRMDSYDPAPFTKACKRARELIESGELTQRKLEDLVTGMIQDFENKNFTESQTWARRLVAFVLVNKVDFTDLPLE